jgi:membrane associated rhomboid family serine protease
MIKDSPITIILLVANVIFSYQGLAKPSVMERYLFRVDRILGAKEYYRMFTSGFLHVDWGHLIMNMMSLYFMGAYLEAIYHVMYGDLGMLVYLIVYFGSLLGGDALALLLHRNHGDYSAVGASGAISGVVFALVVLEPSATILLFMVIPMPFWLFAIAYTGYTLFGIRTKFTRVGHEAHMGGSLIGLALGSLFAIDQAIENWILIVGLAVPSVLILYAMYKNPLLGDNPLDWLKRVFGQGNPRPAGTQTRNSSPSANPFEGPAKHDGLEVNRRAMLQKELDDLLDRISKKGYHTLSNAEKARLDVLGKELGRNTNMGGGRAPGGG